MKQFLNVECILFVPNSIFRWTTSARFVNRFFASLSRQFQGYPVIWKRISNFHVIISNILAMFRRKKRQKESYGACIYTSSVKKYFPVYNLCYLDVSNEYESEEIKSNENEIETIRPILSFLSLWWNSDKKALIELSFRSDYFFDGKKSCHVL